MFRCNIEEFPARGPSKTKRAAVGGTEDFERLLDSYAKSPSVSIEIQRDPVKLIVSLSSGDYAVLAATGEDDFFDLVGDPDAKGWATFNHGGQPANHPRRHFVTKKLLLEAVMAVLRDGKISDQHQWEKQGEFQTA